MKVKSKFAIPYDNVGELEMRLYNTVIRYEGVPVLITGMGTNLEGKLYVKMTSEVGPTFEKVYGNDPGFDLSPLPPIYTNFGQWSGASYWVSRQAVRKYQQGANGGNTKYVKVGMRNPPVPCSPRNILTGYSQHPKEMTLQKARKKYDLRPTAFISLALSVHVAIFVEREPLYGHPTGKILVEYHGEVVGELIDEGENSFIKTENESLSFNPWCIERLGKVGIHVR